MDVFRNINPRYFAPDPRSLSFARCLTGILLMLDAFYRLKYAKDFMSDEGIWPSEYVTRFGWQPGYWSLFLLNNSDSWMYALLILYAIFSFLFCFGVGGKPVQFLLWILLTSIHNRNLYVLQSGDDLLRLFLLLGLFTHMHSFFTPFSKKNHAHHSESLFSSGGILLYTLLFCLYAFSVLNKSTGTDWIPDGMAVYYALSIDQIRLPAGDMIYQCFSCMKVLTYLVFFSQLLIALLIFFPFRISFCRGLAFLIIVLMQTAFALTLKVGFFPFISMAVATILIPASWWDFIEKKFSLSGLSLPAFKHDEKSLISKNAFLFLLFSFFMLGINLSTFRYFPYEPHPVLRYIIHLFRMDQYWGMFSPNVPKDDGWPEAWGRRHDGSIVVLMSPEENNPGNKTDHLYSYFPTDRWRKLTENMSRSEYTFLRPLFCSYLLRKFKDRFQKEKLAGIELVFFREKNEANYKTTGLTNEIWCYCIPQ